jgi:hypothetical protein
MDLRADGSGLIPSDLNAERGRVGWLNVDPHDSDVHCADPNGTGPTSSLLQT